MNDISRMQTLLKKYVMHEINQEELVNCSKILLHENLKENRYAIDFIKEYHIITEIMDLEDCDQQECDSFVGYYLDVYNGKESFETMISVLLCEEYLPEDVLDVLFLIEKCILGSEISAQEYYRIQCFMKDTNREHSTLHDLVIEQLKSVIRWAFDFDSEALLYNPKSILYILDENDLKTNVFSEMKSIIAALLGKKPIWIRCFYENGGCNIQVLI